MYIITYANGEAAWFESLPEVLRHLEFDDFNSIDCGIYQIKPGNIWVDAIREVERAIREEKQNIAWDMEHDGYISSPEKTGRV